MRKETKLIQQIKALKVTKGFTVATDSERMAVCRAASELKRYGVIDFDIVTKKSGDAFKVAAI